MTPPDIAFIKAVIAFVLVAGTGMTAFWLWLRARARVGPDLSKFLSSLGCPCGSGAAVGSQVA